jgi:hypothetical protein
MSPRRSFGFIAIVFAIVYAIAYVIAVWKNLALFTYHPVLGTVMWGVQRPIDGPAMYWYGWIAAAAIPATLACAIAYVIPERLASRVWSGWSWVAPVGVLFFFAYMLSGYFLR